MSSVDINAFLESRKEIIDLLIEKMLPRSVTKEYVNFISGKPAYAYDTTTLDNGISIPVWDFLSRGGKRWRPALFTLIVEALGGDIENVRDFAALPELVHNGTIIIDDIEDGADIRRGKPSLHLLYGVDTAINAGNALYFIPLALLLRNEHNFTDDVMLKIYNIYAREMINVHLGQALDISWHRGEKKSDTITEEQYIQMCAYKTGTLARMSAKIAAVLSGASSEHVDILGKFAESIGIAFQIQDDILDIITEGEDRDKFGKPYGNDITEGKITLLVIKTLQRAPPDEAEKLLGILSSHTKDKDKIDTAIGIIKSYGAIKSARKVADALVISSWEDARRILPKNDARNILESFVYYLIDRKA
ncbi:MAG: polyprenyl synthetase family protein [Candidatus Methanofastidiosia archaeon]